MPAPLKPPETVHDQASFEIFVEGLIAERRCAAKLDLSRDGFQGEWANTTIEDFLDSALTWAQDSSLWSGATARNPWRQFAEFLWAGRSYE